MKKTLFMAYTLRSIQGSFKNILIMPKCIQLIYNNALNIHTFCKKKKCMFSKVCFFHSNIYILFIQSIWRGYIIRRKLKQFSKLPSDLWNIVLYFSKYDYNIKKKLYISYYKIYSNKLIHYYKKLEYFDTLKIDRILLKYNKHLIYNDYINRNNIYNEHGSNLITYLYFLLRFFELENLMGFFETNHLLKY